MEAVAKQVTSYRATEMNIKQKKTMALQVIRGEESITHLAKENQVSRKFVYKQKHQAIQAIDNVWLFDTSCGNQKAHSF